MAEATLSESAPAKLNLDLRVTGRTPEGYHTLDSLVVFAPIADRLTFSHAEELALEITGPFAAGLEGEAENLVLRAARGLAAAVGRPPRVRIVLEKNLPVASGIGGGSADAAATLRGLRRFFALDWTEAQLRELGLGLGADVPVCVYGRPARLRGIGERLDPIRGLPELPLVLVNPGVTVSTSAVFRELEIPVEAFARRGFPAYASVTAVAAWLGQSRNELEPVALRLAPVIGEALAALRAQDACLLARMSGSGATCFGIFVDTSKAEAAAMRLATEAPSWWCRDCVVQGDRR